MDFNTYQTEALKTAIYPNKGKNLHYVILGLCGESGEVAEKFKKILRDKHGMIDSVDIINITKELGDVLWYISAICNELDIKLDDVAKTNITKLNKRLENNTLHGSGDNR